MDEKYLSELFDAVEDIVAIRDKQGVAKLRRGLRQAMRIVDQASQTEYASHKYRFGAGKHKLKERGGRFRDFAKRATAYRYRFNVAKGQKPWRFQSMMKRKGRDNTYQGNLSHLLEDGAWNVKYQKQNRAYKVRQAAFEKSRTAAQARAIQAFKEAIGVNS